MQPAVTVRREGELSIITGPTGLSHHGQLVVGTSLFVTGNAYKTDSLYDTVYVELFGEDRSIREDQGVLPSMFVGPDGALWAVVTNPYGDRDTEVVRAVGGPVKKPRAPFVGEPLWLDGDILVRVKGSSFDPHKPDRMMRYDLRTEKAQTFTIPLPALGRYLRSADGIHCVARTSHRLLSPKGEVLRERTLDVGELMVEPVDLSFEAESTLIGANREAMWWLTVSPDGSTKRRELVKGNFYSLYPPERAGDAIVVRYVDERGNGWVSLKERSTRAVHSTESGYVDREGQTVVALPKRKKWILSGLSAVGRDIAVSFYEQAAGGDHPPALWVARVPTG
jgi:hypothetical protein